MAEMLDNRFRFWYYIHMTAHTINRMTPSHYEYRGIIIKRSTIPKRWGFGTQVKWDTEHMGFRRFDSKKQAAAWIDEILDGGR